MALELRIAQLPEGDERKIQLDEVDELSNNFSIEEKIFLSEEKEDLGIPYWDASEEYWEQYYWNKYQKGRIGVQDDLERTLAPSGLFSLIQMKLKNVCGRRNRERVPQPPTRSAEEKKIDRTREDGPIKAFATIVPLEKSSSEQKPLLGLQSSGIRAMDKDVQESDRPNMSINFFEDRPSEIHTIPTSQTPIKTFMSNILPVPLDYDERPKRLEIRQPVAVIPPVQEKAKSNITAKKAHKVLFVSNLEPSKHDRKDKNPREAIESIPQLLESPPSALKIAGPDSSKPSQTIQPSPQVLPSRNLPIRSPFYVSDITPLKREEPDEKPRLPQRDAFAVLVRPPKAHASQEITPVMSRLHAVPSTFGHALVTSKKTKEMYIEGKEVLMDVHAKNLVNIVRDKSQEGRLVLKGEGNFDDE